MPKFERSLVFALCIAFAISSCETRPDNVAPMDVSGQWQFEGYLTQDNVEAQEREANSALGTSRTPSRSMPSASKWTSKPLCSFEQTGDRITGTCKEQYGAGTANGAVHGDKIRFTWNEIADQAGGKSGPLRFSGSLDSDTTMKGNLSTSSSVNFDPLHPDFTPTADFEGRFKGRRVARSITPIFGAINSDTAAIRNQPENTSSPQASSEGKFITNDPAGPSHISPDDKFVATIKVAGPDDCESILEIAHTPLKGRTPDARVADAPELRQEVVHGHSFISSDHKSGMCIDRFEWTPDSKYLVLGLENSGEPERTHYAVQIYSIENWAMFDLESGLPALITSAEFRIVGLHSVEVETMAHIPLGQSESKRRTVDLSDFVQGRIGTGATATSSSNIPAQPWRASNLHEYTKETNCVIVMQYSPDATREQQDKGLSSNSVLKQSAKARVEAFDKGPTELREVNASADLPYVLHRLSNFHQRCCIQIAVIARASADGSIEMPYDLPHLDELSDGERMAYGRRLGGPMAKTQWGRDRLDELMRGVGETVCKGTEADAVKSFQVLYGGPEK